jgi:Fe-Mn family superoxide dismutase
MTLNRRHCLFLLGVSAGSFLLENYALSEVLSNSKVKNQSIQLPPLPYAYDALEPHIDEKTMQLHHDKHHAAYVTNLNTALDKYPDLKNQDIEQLLQNLNQVPADIRNTVRNNGGGHLNHSMFWQIMQPNGGGEPTGKIATAINQNFGNFAEFKKQFNASGLNHFGSGWVWLVPAKNGKLAIVTTTNQDSPLMADRFPILGNDVWEHAYYLKYQNRRADYLNAWWNVVNWDEINRRFAIAMQKS